ncbi:PDZ domain-containing protein [Paenibacillus thiaminolyticus]|uniref:PDZ domain-containing protein n=1 Tax=Paenibacillus thiaminolyticus TaxID=49283 RepID=A0A3A3GHX2_PANTH|nr:PDZ domain-containing protein [Paenibacillus thiaminolyticus]
MKKHLAILVEVAAGTPADGILAVGDIITDINGMPVHSYDDLEAVVTRTGTGGEDGALAGRQAARGAADYGSVRRQAELLHPFVISVNTPLAAGWKIRKLIPCGSPRRPLCLIFLPI